MTLKNIKFYRKDIGVYFIIIGFLVFPFILREQFLGQAGLLNVFVYLGIVLSFLGSSFCLFVKSHRYDSKNIFNLFCFLLFLVIASGLVFFIKGNGYSNIRKIIILFLSVFPSIFIFSSVSKHGDVDHLTSIWLKALRIVCSLMILFWFIDLVIGNKIQLFLCNFYDSSTLLNLVGINRFVSFYGHSLQSTAIFLMLAIWTTMKKRRNKSYIYDNLIALMGIAVCGSKSGLLLILLLILLTNFGVKNIKFLFLILIVFGILYLCNVFDLVFARIIEGYQSGDLSTSRNTALEKLISDGVISFNWFSGHEYIYGNTTFTAATEYPFVHWAYVFGIFFMLLQYLIYFVKPGLQILKCRNLVSLICILVLMAYFNANNGIVSFNDDLLLYSFNIFLVVNLTRKRYEMKRSIIYDKNKKRIKRISRGRQNCLTFN